MYLLDTSIASFSFRVDPLLQLYNDELESGAPLFISAQTVAEIFFGMALKSWGAKKRTRMDETLARFAVLPMDNETAKVFADVMMSSRVLGRRLNIEDAWIVSTARQYGLLLLTHDPDMSIGDQFGVKVICRA